MTTFTSTTDGLWTTPATWGGGPGDPVPGSGDTAVIYNRVYMNANATVGVGSGTAITIQTAGLLSITPIVNTTLTLRGCINIANGGEFRIGTSAARILSTVKVTVLFSTSSRYIYVNGAGTIQAWGAEDYHMAAGCQRTTLRANITAGVGAAITTVDAVDWSVGDVIWVGTGGDQTATPTTCEQVTILTKINTTHYTATFVYDHKVGDFLVNSERNIIFMGSAASASSRGSIVSRIASTANDLGNAKLLLDSVQLKWMGAGKLWNTSAIGLTVNTSGSIYNVPANTLHLKNITIDTGSTSYPEQATGIFLNITCGMDDSETAFDNIHTYGCANSVLSSGEENGVLKFSNCTMINGWYGFYNGLIKPRIYAENFWYCGKDRTVSQVVPFYQAVPYSVTNFKITNHSTLHYGNLGFGDLNYAVNETSVWDTGYAYWGAVGGTNEFLWSTAFGIQPTFIFNSVVFYSMAGGILYLYGHYGNVFFNDCSFDACNLTGGGAGGSSPVGIDGVYTGTALRFYNCTFGTAAANGYFGCISMVGSLIVPISSANSIRMLFEKCIIKEPTNFSTGDPSSHAWDAPIAYVFQDENKHLGLWTYRCQWGQLHTLELVDCQLLDSSDVDQWSVAYGASTRVGIVAGGCELRDEPTVVIDNTLKLAIYPFAVACRSHVTKAFPIRIPLTAGQDITVKVSLRKTQSQATGRRPMVHMYGLGIDTYSEMTDVNNIWEEQTLTGTAVITGSVEVWFSVMNEHDNTVYLADNSSSPKALGWLIVYVDGFSAAIA